MNQPTVEVRASRWRNVFFCLSLMPGTLIAGELVASGRVNVTQAIAIASVVAGVATFWPRTDLVIRDGVLQGPRPWGLGRTCIPLAEIDFDRSRASSTPRLIWSIHGHAIWVDAIGIPSAARRRVTDALGLTMRRF